MARWRLFFWDEPDRFKRNARLGMLVINSASLAYLAFVVVTMLIGR